VALKTDDEEVVVEAVSTTDATVLASEVTVEEGLLVTTGMIEDIILTGMIVVTGIMTSEVETDSTMTDAAMIFDAIDPLSEGTAGDLPLAALSIDEVVVPDPVHLLDTGMTHHLDTGMTVHHLDTENVTTNAATASTEVVVATSTTTTADMEAEMPVVDIEAKLKN
jgi:hypothetical protein